MKEHKLSEPVIITGHTRENSQKSSYKIAGNNNLPPLSMKLYAHSEKQVQKKQKQVQSRIQEAENMIAIELGRTMHKSPKRFAFRILKIK